MNIAKTQNVAFNGTVHLEGQAKSNDPILRPLIHHLKYNCGSKDIHHYIKVCDADDFIQLKSVYHSKTKRVGGFCIILDSGKKKTADYVKELIRKTDSLSLIYKIFKNEEGKIIDLNAEIENCKNLISMVVDKKIATKQESFFTSLSKFLIRKKK